MTYYILYPRSRKDDVRIDKTRPSVSEYKKYGFAEGPFRTKRAVKIRLNKMGYSIPQGF